MATHFCSVATEHVQRESIIRIGEPSQIIDLALDRNRWKKACTQASFTMEMDQYRRILLRRQKNDEKEGLVRKDGYKNVILEREKNFTKSFSFALE
jgi:hypothetical protein